VENKLKALFIYLVLVVSAAITIFPFLWVVLSSLKNRVDVFAIPPKWIFTPTINNYLTVLQNSDYVSYLINSLIISTCAVLISLVFGSCMAYAFSRFHFAGKEQLTFFVITTRMAPPIGFVLSFFILLRSLSLLDNRLGLVIVYIPLNMAFVVWMMKGFFDEIPSTLDDSAMVDGYTRIGAFIKVILPLCKPGLVATAIFSYIITWNEFLYAFILTRSASRTLPTLIPQFMGVVELKWETMCAAAILTVLPVIIFGLLIQKHLVRGLTMGAVKG